MKGGRRKEGCGKTKGGKMVERSRVSMGGKISGRGGQFSGLVRQDWVGDFCDIDVSGLSSSSNSNNCCLDCHYHYIRDTVFTCTYLRHIILRVLAKRKQLTF